MVNESDIRLAFLKVKQDIDSLGKVLNNLRAQVGELSKNSSGLAGKKELYDFIDALELRLEKLDELFISSKDYEKIASSYDKKLEKQKNLNEQSLEPLKQGLDRISSRQLELSGQLNSLKTSLSKVTSVESKLADISARMGDSNKVSSGLAKLQARVSEIMGQVSSLELRILEIPDSRSLLKRLEELELKFIETKKLVKESDISELKAELSELTKEFSKLGKRFVDWSEFSK